MTNASEWADGRTWRSVLHNDIQHRLSNERKQLRASSQTFGISQCGIVCTLDAYSSGSSRCPVCFPLWPKDGDTEVIPRPPLPKRVSQPVPQPGDQAVNQASDWFRN